MPAVAYAINTRLKYLLFRPYWSCMTSGPNRQPDKGYYFRFYNPNSDIKLVKLTLEDNGFKDVTKSGKYNEQGEWHFMWSSQSLKSNVYQALTKY